MPRKVFKAGNSLVVSIPKEAVEQLGLSEGSEAEVELDRESRRILVTFTPSYPTDIDREFASQVAEFIEEYRPALDKLAGKE